MNEVAPEGPGPHDPEMDARVSRLEEEMGDVRAILRRIEPMIVRIDAQLPYFATREDFAALRGDFSTKFAVLRGEVTTEISTLRGEMTTEFANVRGEIQALRGEVTTEISTLRGEVTTEISTLRGEVSAEISTLRGEVTTEISTLRGEVTTEFANVRGKMGTFRGDLMAELATKPSRGAMWTMGIALFGLVVAAMAAGAAYLPLIAERLRALT